MLMPDRFLQYRLYGLFLLLLTASVATAQEEQPRSLDADIFFAVHSLDQPVPEAIFRGIDWSSTRSFLLASPISGAIAFAQSGELYDLAPAYRMGMSQVLATGLVYSLKYTVQRYRPYETLDISSRSPNYYRGKPTWSFPSTHAALSFAIATSASLSAEEWYVTIPALTWASLVATSRIWLGVHYPSDVLVGTLIGTGSAILIHAIADWITPSFLESPDTPVTTIPLVMISW